MSAQVGAEPDAAFCLFTDTFQTVFHASQIPDRKDLVGRILELVVSLVPFYQLNGYRQKFDDIGGFGLYPVADKPYASIRIGIHILIA